ncbi:hypothetical protein [Halobaculum sp. MBLA0143]|uniref:hypothetical protein n=1 Tax=Halobaculum sp. MBLA0143 TaxID=3079933 RepID=UPI0035234B51
MVDSEQLPEPSLPELLLVTAFLVPVTVVALDLLGVVNLTSGGLPVDVATFADIAGVFGSVVSTFALVLLYREQTKIQRRQEEWMAADHVPDVFVDEWEVTQNRIELGLSNLGTGVARNLRVKATAETTGPHGVSTVTFGTRVSREPSPARVLRPDEDDVTKFVGDLDVDEVTGSLRTTDSSVENVLTWLNAEDSPIEVTLRIEYDHVGRESDSQQVFCYLAGPQKLRSAEDLLVSTDDRAEGELGTTDD